MQLNNGAFDLYVIYAPDGIEHFAGAWSRHVDVEGFPVCHIDDIIASKEAANRVWDRESLPGSGFSRLAPQFSPAQIKSSLKGRSDSHDRAPHQGLSPTTRAQFGQV